MEKLKDVYVKMLLGAVIIFAFGMVYMLSELYYRVGEMEHDMMHVKDGQKCTVRHSK